MHTMAKQARTKKKSKEIEEATINVRKAFHNYAIAIRHLYKLDPASYCYLKSELDWWKE